VIPLISAPIDGAAARQFLARAPVHFLPFHKNRLQMLALILQTAWHSQNANKEVNQMSSTPWTLTGNLGTSPATDFIGTSDNQPLVVKTTGAQRALIDTSGNIELTGQLGIGTSSPHSALEVAVDAASKLGPVITLTNTGGLANAAAALDLNTFSTSATGTYKPTSPIEAQDDGHYSNDFVVLANKPGAPNNGLAERVRITATGIGIGTAAPRSSLEISSNAGGPGGLGPVITLTNQGLTMLGSDGSSFVAVVRSAAAGRRSSLDQQNVLFQSTSSQEEVIV
jgi:hypothetical protein